MGLSKKKSNKSVQKEVSDLREKLFSESRERSRIRPFQRVVKLRKREQESELKKWFIDTFDVNIEMEDYDQG